MTSKTFLIDNSDLEIYINTTSKFFLVRKIGSKRYGVIFELDRLVGFNSGRELNERYLLAYTSVEFIKDLKELAYNLVIECPTYTCDLTKVNIAEQMNIVKQLNSFLETGLHLTAKY